MKYDLLYRKNNSRRDHPSHEQKTVTFSRCTIPKQRNFVPVTFVLFWFCLFHSFLQSDCLRRKIIDWGLNKHLYKVFQSIDNKFIVKWSSVARSVQCRLQCCACYVSLTRIDKQCSWNTKPPAQHVVMAYFQLTIHCHVETMRRWDKFIVNIA